MAKILLTGASGQVGRETERALLRRGHCVLSLKRSGGFDISDEDSVRSAVFDTAPDAVINAAAYTNVEKAEDEKTRAFKVNAYGPFYLASACRQADIPLIHLSTDYVFSDRLFRPHTEEDQTSTECSYGLSKLFGENYVRNTLRRHVIIRSSWIFGRFGRNFVKVMLALARDKSEIAVVGDQFGNPTPAEPLSEAVATVTEYTLSPDFNAYGTYHFCGYDPVSWAQFAQAVFDMGFDMGVLDHRVRAIPIRSADFNSKVSRPPDSRLDCHKIASVLGIALPFWSDYLCDSISAYARECRGLPAVED